MSIEIIKGNTSDKTFNIHCITRPGPVLLTYYFISSFTPELLEDPANVEALRDLPLTRLRKSRSDELGNYEQISSSLGRARKQVDVLTVISGIMSR